jgi:hypothetical protein
MSKRFTDTEKYRKEFVRSLPGAYKLLWDFIINECDYAGIWYVDFEIAQLCVGRDMPVRKDKALRLFNGGEVRILELENGKRWFIISFIAFQYGKLSSSNPAHRGIISELKRYNLIDSDLNIKSNLCKEDPPEGLPSPSKGTMDMDKDMDMDIKGGVGEKQEPAQKTSKIKYAEFVSMTNDEYTSLVAKLGNEEDARRCIEILDNYKGATGKKYRSDYRAILNWVTGRLKEEKGPPGKKHPAVSYNSENEKFKERWNRKTK